MSLPPYLQIISIATRHIILTYQAPRSVTADHANTSESSEDSDQKPLRPYRTLNFFYYLCKYRKLLVILCVRNWSGDA